MNSCQNLLVLVLCQILKFIEVGCSGATFLQSQHSGGQSQRGSGGQPGLHFETLSRKFFLRYSLYNIKFEIKLSETYDIFTVLCNYHVQPVLKQPCSPRGTVTQGAGRPYPQLTLLQTQVSLMESLCVKSGRLVLPVCSPAAAELQVECCGFKCRLESGWEHGSCCSQCRPTNVTNPVVPRRSCSVAQSVVCFCCRLFRFGGWSLALVQSGSRSTILLPGLLRARIIGQKYF